MNGSCFWRFSDQSTRRYSIATAAGRGEGVGLLEKRVGMHPA
jgi:hypothetical protein